MLQQVLETGWTDRSTAADAESLRWKTAPSGVDDTSSVWPGND